LIKQSKDDINFYNPIIFYEIKNHPGVGWCVGENVVMTCVAPLVIWEEVSVFFHRVVGIWGYV
jgi:hypothetical protein